MIAVKNVLRVMGGEVEVIRFVYDKRMNGEVERWELREPAPEDTVSERFPKLSLYEGRMATAILEVTTDWYPATHDILALSADYPELTLDMEFEAAPSSAEQATRCGGVEFHGGEVEGWNYGPVGGEQVDGGDCPMPWWTWSAEAVAAWARFIGAE